jgi:hypothetical protein
LVQFQQNCIIQLNGIYEREGEYTEGNNYVELQINGCN